MPDMQPRHTFELIKKFITSKHPDAKVTLVATLDPYQGAVTGPHLDAAGRAIEAAFGTKPALVREGGSVGAVLTMRKYVDTPIIMLPLSLPEHSWHAPGEFFDWGQASGGIKMYAHYFQPWPASSTCHQPLP